MSQPILFFGNERLASGVTTSVPVLQALVVAGHKVGAVVIAQADAAKSRKERPPEIVQIANQHNIPVLSPFNLLVAEDEVRAFGANAAVLVAYGKLVPAEIIDLFPKGIINIHPSLLPHRRGSTPIESVILDDERDTGVSLMRLTTGLDAGPVYAQQKLSLQGNESKQQLADRLLVMGRDLLIEQLPGILNGSIEPQAQNDKLATHTPRLKKSDGELDFTKPATELEREVRAYSGWPRSRAKLGTTEVVVTAARAGEANGVMGTLWLDNKELGVYAAKGVLIIDRLIPTGKPEMTAQAFLAGYNPI